MGITIAELALIAKMTTFRRIFIKNSRSTPETVLKNAIKIRPLHIRMENLREHAHIILDIRVNIPYGVRDS